MRYSTILNEKKQGLNNHGRIHYGILIMLTLMIILLCMMFLENRIIVSARDCADNSLTIAVFSSSLCNTQKMKEYIIPVKTEDNGTVSYDFDKIIVSCPIIIANDRKILERVQFICSNNITNTKNMQGVLRDIQIAKLIIYNVEGSKIEITEYGRNNGVNTFNSYMTDTENVISPNGVKIHKTSVYIKADFTYEGLLIKNKRVSLEKCIEIKRLMG